MNNIRVHLGPGLPKTMSTSQEMNDCFQDFKDKSNSCAQDIFLVKVHDHSLESKHHDIEGGGGGKGSLSHKQ